MSSSRIPSLDGLRALSIFMVCLGHFSFTPGFPITHFVLTDEYAHYGVRIFFVISGFLITTLLLRERERTGTINLKQFYIRRAYRILPAAYVYMVVITIVFHSFTYKQLILVFTYLSSYLVHIPWVFGHLWSLSVEEQFYLIWPALALSALLSRRFAFAAIVLAPLIRLELKRNGLPLEAVYFFPSVMDSLAAGCLLALYQPDLKKYHSFFTWQGFPLIWAFTLSIPVLRYYCYLLKYWPLPQIVHISVLSLFNLGIVLCIQNAIIVRPRILNAAPLVWIGSLSYSFYLWQMPFTNPDVHSWATAFPQNLVLALLVAMVSYYAIEQPILRFRERQAKPYILRYSLATPSGVVGGRMGGKPDSVSDPFPSPDQTYAQPGKRQHDED